MPGLLDKIGSGIGGLLGGVKDVATNPDVWGAFGHGYSGGSPAQYMSMMNQRDIDERRKEFQQRVQQLGPNPDPAQLQELMITSGVPELETAAIEQRMRPTVQTALERNAAAAGYEPGTDGYSQFIRQQLDNTPADLRTAQAYGEMTPEERENYERSRSLRAYSQVNPDLRRVMRTEDVADIQATEPEMTDQLVERAERTTAAQSGGLNLTPAQEAIDRKFADQYAEFVTGGGSADVARQIEQVEQIADRLDAIAAGESDENLTGKIGYLPDMFGIQSSLAPVATDAREQLEEVVQRNLRTVLGAQFTEEEGKRLIARAYNDKLDESYNAPRVRRLLNQMKQAAEAKQAAAEYYERYGTLQGFDGRIYTKRDFMDMSFNPDDDPAQGGGWSIQRVD